MNNLLKAMITSVILMFILSACSHVNISPGVSTLIFTHVDGVLTGDLPNHPFYFEEKTRHHVIVSTDETLSLQLERESIFDSILVPKGIIYEGTYLVTTFRTPNHRMIYRAVMLGLMDKGNKVITEQGIMLFYDTADIKLKTPISTAKYTYKYMEDKASK